MRAAMRAPPGPRLRASLGRASGPPPRLLLLADPKATTAPLPSQQRRPLCRRFSSPAAPRDSESEPPPPPPPPPRWLSDLRARVGKCLFFGCDAAQTARAAVVARALATEWRALLAGSEGFLTDGRRGLDGHQVLFGDMDSFQHVNNATYIRWAGAARVNWVLAHAATATAAGDDGASWRQLLTPAGLGLILQSIRADFKLPMAVPDRASVYTRLHAPPAGGPAEQASLLLLDAVVLSHRHRRVAARTREHVVLYDYRRAARAAPPAWMHRALARTWRLQCDEEKRARARIWHLVREVEGLEADTWAREGAVEEGAG